MQWTRNEHLPNARNKALVIAWFIVYKSNKCTDNSRAYQAFFFPLLMFSMHFSLCSFSLWWWTRVWCELVTSENGKRKRERERERNRKLNWWVKYTPFTVNLKRYCACFNSKQDQTNPKNAKLSMIFDGKDAFLRLQILFCRISWDKISKATRWRERMGENELERAC